MSVDNDERHVSSNINSCIGFVKYNKSQPIISNKLDIKIIPKPMPCIDNSILDTSAKCTNDCSKTINHSEIEPMDMNKSHKTIHTVVVKHHVKEKEVATSKINFSDIYGAFSTDFSPLVLMKVMTGNKSRNAIVYKFPFLIKTPVSYK